MVDPSIILICLPTLAYYAGIVVSHFTKDEMAKWEKYMRIIIRYFPVVVLISLLSNYSALNAVYALLMFSTSLLIFLLVPKSFLEKKYIECILLGLSIGVQLNNYPLIISVCIFYYLKANLDSYNNKNLVKDRLSENVLYLVTGLITYFTGFSELAVFGVLGLIIMRFRLK